MDGLSVPAFLRSPALVSRCVFEWHLCVSKELDLPGWPALECVWGSAIVICSKVIRRIFRLAQQERETETHFFVPGERVQWPELTRLAIVLGSALLGWHVLIVHY